MGAIIAVIGKKEESVVETAVRMLKTPNLKNTEAVGIGSPFATKIEKNDDALQCKVNSQTIIGHLFSRTLVSHETQFIKLKKATLIFEGRFYPTNLGISDAYTVTEKMEQNPNKVAMTLVKECEGYFAFIIAEPGRLTAGRDSLGIQSLYYGENTKWAALSSELKALWKIGIEKAFSFPPGHIAFVDKNGFKFLPVKTLSYSKPKRTTMQAAVKKLQRLLQKSINQRVAGLKEVAVAFSGGLDSSIIAFLAKKTGVDVHLTHVSLANQLETEYAKTVAEELKLPIHVHLYSEENVKEILPKVLWLIEKPDPIQTGIGIPIYWAAETMSETKFKVVLAGQGADELFGGYKRYVDNYLRYGKEKAQETISSDILRLHEINFERDTKICNFHNVDLRLPFATYEIAKFALDLPLELKIEPSNNSLRKLLLRQVAKDLDLPKLVVEKPKKAIQYTTGISKVLERLAKKQRLPISEYLQQIFQKSLKEMNST